MLEHSFGYDRKNFISTYYGLNHFGWYKEIYDITREMDIMPEILEKIVSSGFDTSIQDDSWAHAFNIMADMTKIFPTYLPNNYLQYYLLSDRIIKNEDPNYTRANQIMDNRLKKIKETVCNIKENKDLDTIDYESSNHGLYIVEIASIINPQ